MKDDDSSEDCDLDAHHPSDCTQDDSYENGTSKASKMRTVTRIASLTPTSPVTVGTFELFDIKNDDSYEDRNM